MSETTPEKTTEAETEAPDNGTEVQEAEGTEAQDAAQSEAGDGAAE